jgi:multiple sugar transport system permease protein
MATLARGVAAQRSVAFRLCTPKVGGYVLVLPAIIYVLALIGFLLVLGVWYSLTNTTVAQPGTFVGLKNFVDVAKDPTFILAARNTLIIGVIATAAKITLSVALAFLMLGAFPGRGILRILFVLPWTIPIALSTIAYKWMFHSQYSVINWMLIHVGIIDQGIQWLGTPIPFIALLFDLIFTLTELTVVFILTGGGPVDQTQVLANYALQVGVSGTQLGQGAAIALYLLPVLLVLTILSLRHIGKREGM